MRQENTKNQNAGSKIGRAYAPPTILDGGKEAPQQHTNQQGSFLADSNFIEDVKHQFLKIFTTIQNFEPQSMMNRKSVCAVLIGIIVLVVASGGLLLTLLLSILVLLFPFWFPVALVTFPAWFTLTVVTSPVWVPLAIMVGAFISTVIAIAFFFAWPEEWLPSKEESRTVAIYHMQRDRLTLQLAKMQAKLLLYAAGIGPAADAMFMMLDRVDLQSLFQKLRQLDWADLGEKIKHGQLNELQKIALEIIQSLIP